jgi:HSP20 family protein
MEIDCLTKIMEDNAMLPVFRRKSDMPSLADEFFGRDLLSNFFDFETGISVPAVNIVEGKDEFRIEVAAPGLNKNDFHVDVQNDVLVISSEKQMENEKKEEKFMRREFSYRSFRRSFSLPQGANVDKITANHKDGVLSIVIPKKEEAKEKPARNIQIN